MFGFRQIDIMVGIAVFLIGLAKKNLIADQLASYAAPGFAAADGGSDISAATAWVSALSYIFQIYSTSPAIQTWRSAWRACSASTCR